MEKIRVLAGDVGGGFGLKNGVQRDEVAVVAASIDLGRPVKWIEDRLEHLAVGGQAREEGADIEAAVTDDGVLLGVRIDAMLNLGAYASDPFNGAIYVDSLSGAFQGPTKIEGIGAKHTVVFSNKATYVAYRGPWATGDFLRERLLDVIARELDIDPLEVRRRNYVERVTCRRWRCSPASRSSGSRPASRSSRPRRSPTGTTSAAARPRRWTRVATSASAWPRTSRRRRGPGYRARRTWPRPSWARRSRKSSLDDDGTIVIVTRQQPHGQSHETTLAQVAVDELSVRFEDVRVVFGDTDITPIALVGTGGSRAATLANGAVLHGSRALRAKILSLAADLLEASADDLRDHRGRHQRRGLSGRAAPDGGARPDRGATNRSASPRAPTPSST